MRIRKDGTVRQHDLRTHHRCSSSACPQPLVTLPHDLSALALSPLAPYYFVVGGESECVSFHSLSHFMKVSVMNIRATFSIEGKSGAFCSMNGAFLSLMLIIQHAFEDLGGPREVPVKFQDLNISLVLGWLSQTDTRLVKSYQESENVLIQQTLEGPFV